MCVCLPIAGHSARQRACPLAPLRHRLLIPASSFQVCSPLRGQTDHRVRWDLPLFFVFCRTPGGRVQENVCWREVLLHFLRFAHRARSQRSHGDGRRTFHGGLRRHDSKGEIRVRFSDVFQMRAPHVSSSFPIAIPYRLSYRHHYCHPQISHASHHNHHPNQHPPQNPYRRPPIPTPNPNPKSGRFRCSIRASRSSNPNPKSQPQIWQVQIFNSGVSQLLAMAASNEALRYVSFPTQVLGKSCKMVPVMAGGILLGGKKYSLSAYIQVRDQMRRGGGGAGGLRRKTGRLSRRPRPPPLDSNSHSDP